LGAGKSGIPAPSGAARLGVGRSGIAAPEGTFLAVTGTEGRLGVGRSTMLLGFDPLGAGRSSITSPAGFAHGANAGTAANESQLLPSLEICSSPSSLPLCSMVTIALSTKGPNVLPVRRRT